MRKGRAVAKFLLSARHGVYLGLLFVLSPAAAQPVTERILSDAAVTEEPGCAHLEIRFNLPVRYLSHFPYQTGRDLCIRVRPVAFGANEKAFRFSREALRPPPGDLAAVSGIEYLGDAVGGICLNVLFRYPVYYSVAQGADYRSIEVAISGPEPQPACKAWAREIQSAPGGPSDTPESGR